MTFWIESKRWGIEREHKLEGNPWSWREDVGGKFETKDVKEDWEVAMKCIKVFEIGSYAM